MMVQIVTMEELCTWKRETSDFFKTPSDKVSITLFVVLASRAISHANKSGSCKTHRMLSHLVLMGELEEGASPLEGREERNDNTTSRL